ncbi:MAG: hypothetical protein LBP50_09900 [Tannerella sp.]|nr:hypothetical protein [Tannerella sp.]
MILHGQVLKGGNFHDFNSATCGRKPYACNRCPKDSTLIAFYECANDRSMLPFSREERVVSLSPQVADPVMKTCLGKHIRLPACEKGSVFIFTFAKNIILLLHEKKNHNTLPEFIAADGASGAKEI